MQLRGLTVVTGMIVLAIAFELVRRRRLREKFAVLWLTIVLTVVPLAIFPRLLDRITGAVGVESGTSLVFFLALTVLLVICAHLTWEVNRLDEQARALAERIALMGIEVPEATRERR